MANSVFSILKTIKEEGGYVYDCDDSGGPTKFGITQDDMPECEIKNITEGQAANYYLEHYWKPLYSDINSQAIADKLFDQGVVSGIGTVTKLLQECLGLVPDGLFGPRTLAAVNSEPESNILNCFRVRLRQHYQEIVEANPKNNKFLQGWINRVNS